MPVPHREPDRPVDFRPRMNLIELNTIKAAPRRQPYVFPEATPALPTPRPYVFREEVPCVTEKPASEPLGAWEKVAERLDKATEPDEVSGALADLLVQLEEGSQRQEGRMRRFLPKSAALVPPLCIGGALLGATLVLPTAMHAMALSAWVPAASWTAAALAVPIGLTLASLGLGRNLKRVSPGDMIRLGEARARILEVRPLAWLLEVDGAGPRAFPYYLAAFAGAERLPDAEPSLEASFSIE